MLFTVKVLCDVDTYKYKDFFPPSYQRLDLEGNSKKCRKMQNLQNPHTFVSVAFWCHWSSGIWRI